MSGFKAGQAVKFETNFYGNEELDKGTGIVQRFESCENPGNHKCDCGSGGTYFVKVDGTEHVAAYIGKELSEA